MENLLGQLSSSVYVNGTERDSKQHPAPLSIFMLKET